MWLIYCNDSTFQNYLISWNNVLFMYTSSNIAFIRILCGSQSAKIIGAGVIKKKPSIHSNSAFNFLWRITCLNPHTLFSVVSHWWKLSWNFLFGIATSWLVAYSWIPLQTSWNLVLFKWDLFFWKGRSRKVTRSGEYGCYQARGIVAFGQKLLHKTR